MSRKYPPMPVSGDRQFGSDHRRKHLVFQRRRAPQRDEVENLGPHHIDAGADVGGPRVRRLLRERNDLAEAFAPFGTDAPVGGTLLDAGHGQRERGTRTPMRLQESAEIQVDEDIAVHADERPGESRTQPAESPPGSQRFRFHGVFQGHAEAGSIAEGGPDAAPQVSQAEDDVADPGAPKQLELGGEERPRQEGNDRLGARRCEREEAESLPSDENHRFHRTPPRQAGTGRNLDALLLENLPRRTARGTDEEGTIRRLPLPPRPDPARGPDREPSGTGCRRWAPKANIPGEDGSGYSDPHRGRSLSGRSRLIASGKRRLGPQEHQLRECPA